LNEFRRIAIRCSACSRQTQVAGAKSVLF